MTYTPVRIRYIVEDALPIGHAGCESLYMLQSGKYCSGSYYTRINAISVSQVFDMRDISEVFIES